MKKYTVSILFVVFAMMMISVFAKDLQHDEGEYMVITDKYMDYINKILGYEIEKKDPEKKLMMKIGGTNIPSSPTAFTKHWFSPPVSQGITGSCWCYSVTSFFESEIYRLTKQKIKLSEMYIIYWEYYDKASLFVDTKGESVFRRGSQPNSAIRIMKEHGIVPAEAYEGAVDKKEFYDHTKMNKDLSAVLEKAKEEKQWDKEKIMGEIEDVLNKHMGVPPELVTSEPKELSPLQYMKEITKLNPEDYVDFMSLKQIPFYKKDEYPVTDNWFHSKDYHNVPLDVFMKIIKNSVRDGYTICIVGDISEPGFRKDLGVAMIPTWDIPGEFINDNARQIRFTQEVTTDDHAIHLVGYTEVDGEDWFLIKDSGSSGFNAKYKGYASYHEDYVKLKMMNFLIHKDAVKDVLSKYK